jgi:outer membrane protein assembly factor BamB
LVVFLTIFFMGFLIISCSSSHTSSSTSSGAASAAADVLTFHNDVARTGQDLSETVLTTTNVRTPTFGKVAFFTVDGKVDAQPLYLSNVSIPNQGMHSVLYVASEHGSVFAFDAATGQYLWNVSLMGAGESTSDTRGCDEAVSPEIGITATPVIDHTQGPNGAIYVVVMSKDASGNYFQRLHALDVATGAELFGGPKTITASYPGVGDNSSGGSVIFDPAQY